MEPRLRIVVLGANGLIGRAVAVGLAAAGHAVTGVVRRAGIAEAGVDIRNFAAVDASPADLAAFLAAARPDIVVNAIGLLQDGPEGRVEEAHAGFAARLTQALTARQPVALLVHVSIPGNDQDDTTAFARTKRAAEAAIAASGVPHVLLRPGFVVAAPAYGGSALLRAMALLPVDLPEDLAARPFRPVAVGDVVATVAHLAARWQAGERSFAARFDVMTAEAATLGAVLAALRQRLGGPRPRFRLPSPLMRLGTVAGDFAGRLGWRPPVRSTALAELRRGVDGDPTEWMAATGIVPQPLAAMMQDLPATVQERWFGRLYLLKAVVIAGLAMFWLSSGMIGFGPGRVAAMAVLTSRGMAAGLASGFIMAGSLADIVIGLALLWRRTCGRGLVAGMAVSFAYLVGGAILAPDLWLDPLGPLVKVIPALLLMLVALAILDDR